MNIKDIKTGDILLFSPEKGSFISWAITFLTDAPVSHAAMFYNEEEQSIIEETPPQVKVSFAVERFKDREIYVRRLNVKEDLPLSPVIEKAKSYLNEAEPYDKSGLYMVGLLLIYKKFTPNTSVKKVMTKILKKIATSIIKYIHEQRNPGKLPMVCSQFVAQCYNDAGDKYKLKIENGILLKNAAMQDNSFNVLDQVMEIVKSDKRTNLQTLLAPTLKMEDEPSSSGEELCRELKEAFELTAGEITSGITDELIEAVSQFAKAHYLYSSGGTQLQNILPDDFAKVFQPLKDNENMYVFPGDLLNHCENVRDIGTIK
jgi:hypothetical protein